MWIKKWMPVLTIVWVCLIFSFSLQPAEVSNDTSMGFASKMLGFLLPDFLEYVEQMPQEQWDILHFVVRKGAHFTEYMILGILSSVTVVVWKVKKSFAAAILFCVGISGVDEIIQLFVDGRTGRIQDVILDSTGAVVGIGLICLWHWGVSKLNG